MAILAPELSVEYCNRRYTGNEQDADYGKGIELDSGHDRTEIGGPGKDRERLECSSFRKTPKQKSSRGIIPAARGESP